MKDQADQIMERAFNMSQDDPFQVKVVVQQAIELYQNALKLDTNNSECKVLIHRELIGAYNFMERLCAMNQLKLYFFDMELESVDKVLYYAGQQSKQSLRLINLGSVYFSRLSLLLAGETSANKTGYLEKIFVGMNSLNADFRSRIAWEIAKGYYKQTLQEVNKKNSKGAYTLCQKAMQFSRVYEETIAHSRARQLDFKAYKTDEQQAKQLKKVTKLSFQLMAEMEFLVGERTFQHATQVEENLNMDELYDALDSFSAAQKLAFEHQDLELEAKCEAWLGKIYEKALKKESKAMTHYNSVLRLANTLKPRDVTQEAWFKEAKASIDKIREQRRLAEEAAKEAADKPFREMVQEDLDKIKAESQKGCKPFLKFVNEQYAPAAKKLTLTDEQMSEDKLRKFMTTKFALIFHPDKNVSEPRQIQILREEVMRFINIFVEEFK